MKIICFVLLSIFLFSSICRAQEPVGFHWYNEQEEQIKKEDNKPKKDQSNKTQETAVKKLKILRAKFRESLSAAILDSSEENIKRYIILSNLMSEQASEFTIMIQKTLLDNPGLSYSIEHPSESQARNIKIDELKAKQAQTLQQLSTHAGLIYFYRSSEAMDTAMAKTVIHFAHEQHISILGVSVDDQAINGFDKSIKDSKKADELGIHYFPALILIDLKTQEVKPVFYGFMSEDELEKQLFYVATDFKRWW